MYRSPFKEKSFSFKFREFLGLLKIIKANHEDTFLISKRGQYFSVQTDFKSFKHFLKIILK